MFNDTPEQINNHKKSLNKNSRLKKTLEVAQNILVRDSVTGIYTFEKSIPIHNRYIKDTEEVIYRIVRGLYWYHFNQPILSADYEMTFVAGYDLRQAACLNANQLEKRHALIASMRNESRRIDFYSPIFTYWISPKLGILNEGYFLITYRKSVLLYITLENIKFGKMTLQE